MTHSQFGDDGLTNGQRNYLNTCGDGGVIRRRMDEIQRQTHVPLTEIEKLSRKQQVRHRLSQRFHEILKQLGDLHDQKQQDYGLDNDPFANVRSTTDWGQPAWVGAMIRGQDKLKRLQAYARKGTLANEGVEDSFLDLAVYAVIGLVLWEEEKANAARRVVP